MGYYERDCGLGEKIWRRLELILPKVCKNCSVLVVLEPHDQIYIGDYSAKKECDYKMLHLHPKPPFLFGHDH